MKNWLQQVGIGLSGVLVVSCAGSVSETKPFPIDSSAGVEPKENQPFLISGTIIEANPGSLEGFKGGSGNGIDVLLTTSNTKLTPLDRAARDVGSDDLSRRPSKWREFEKLLGLNGQDEKKRTRPR